MNKSTQFLVLSKDSIKMGFIIINFQHYALFHFNLTQLASITVEGDGQHQRWYLPLIFLVFKDNEGTFTYTALTSNGTQGGSKNSQFSSWKMPDDTRRKQRTWVTYGGGTSQRRRHSSPEWPPDTISLIAVHLILQAAGSSISRASLYFIHSFLWHSLHIGWDLEG